MFRTPLIQFCDQLMEGISLLLNWEQTYQATKYYLSQYGHIHSVALRASIIEQTTSPQALSRIPSLKDRYTDALQYKNQCDSITDTIHRLRVISSLHELMSEILDYRYIKGMPAVKVREILMNNGKGIISKTNYTRLLHDALWNFAVLSTNRDNLIKFESNQVLR